MNLYRVMKEHTFTLSLLAFACGMLILILSALAIWAVSLGVGDWFDQAVGSWKYWLFLVGLLAALIGGGFLGAYLVNRKEFFELMDTESKATFTRNLEDLEYVAWKLGTRYELLVDERKAEMGVGRRKSKRG